MNIERRDSGSILKELGAGIQEPGGPGASHVRATGMAGHVVGRKSRRAVEMATPRIPIGPETRIRWTRQPARMAQIRRDLA
jgi:hypothetical protein